MDPRAINSDEETTRTKYDAVILDQNQQPTRFNYRNDQCIVMEGALYDSLGASGNTSVQGEQIWIKQSYYLQLPVSQKHNPGNLRVDPFANIRIGSVAAPGPQTLDITPLDNDSIFPRNI